MTKVLHIIPTLQRGGAERMLTQLVTARRVDAASIEHRVVALREGGPFAREIEDAAIPVTVLGLKGWLTAPGSLFRLSQHIVRWQPDVIQSWLYYADLAACLARVRATRPQPRLYWNIRCSTLDFSSFSPTLGLVARLGARLSRLPDTIVVNSGAGFRAHAELGYAEDKFVVIPNGIDTDRFRPMPAARQRVRQKADIDPDSFVVAHLARVDPQKDHRTLIEVAKRLPDLVFLAAGRGTRGLSGPDNLIGLGDRADAAELLNAADMVVSTSAYGEGFPNVIAEGMACGKPAVSTDCGDAAEIIGDTGTIVPVGDVAAIAKAITGLASLPEPDRRRIGVQARSRIVERYGLPEIIRRYDELYTAGVIRKHQVTGRS